jgi:hypothetical protein
MKKSIFAIMALVLAVALMLTLRPVYGGITLRVWIGTTSYGYDPYYNATVYAYEEGTRAVLAVWVRNTNSSPTAANGVNLTRVYVSFDWGETINSTQVSLTSPLLMKYNEERVFFIEFDVPSTATVSNLYRHSYTIGTEYQYANLTDPTHWPPIKGKFPMVPYQDFAIYSAAQAEVMDSSRRVSGYLSLTISWSSSSAQTLWRKAQRESVSAAEYYREGQFDQARDSYDLAFSYINDAFDTEDSFDALRDDLEVQHMQAEIRSMDALTSFFNGLSTMWVLFGIGWVLLGIGYIVKWLRKRPEPQAATA